MTTNQQVEVGTKIFVRALLIVLVLWFLYAVRDVLALVFLAIIMTASMDPLIKWLKKTGLPRTPSVILSYVGVVALLALLVSFLVPPLASQTADFFNNFRQHVEQFSQLSKALGLGGGRMREGGIVSDIQSGSVGSFSGLFSTTLGIFSGLIAVVVFFFLSLYMSLEENGIEKFLTSVLPERFHEYGLSLTKRVRVKIGQWLFGQLLSMLLIFAVYWIGLAVLGVPYALTLALFGGVLEIVPYVGPIIASIPAVLIAFSVSPVLGLAVLVFYVAAHQIESHAITPQIMRRAVGINPVAVIVALLIGAQLGGILGVILAVPAATVISVFVEDFLEKKSA